MKNFRLTTENDLAAIQQVYQENHISSGGLLVGDLRQTGQRYVVEEQGIIIGYVDIQMQLPERILRETKFFTPLYPLTRNALYIKQVAVAQAYQSKGVGRFSYEKLKSIYPDRDFLAFVHIENAKSMYFHVSGGFYPIGVYAVPMFYQVPNYTAFLLYMEGTVCE